MMNRKKFTSVCLVIALFLTAVSVNLFSPVTAQAKQATPAQFVKAQIIGSTGGGYGMSDNLAAVHDGTNYLVEPYAGDGDSNPYVVTNYAAAQGGYRDLTIYFHFLRPVALSDIYLYCFTDYYSASVPESIEISASTDLVHYEVLTQYEPVFSEQITDTCYLVEYVNTGDPVTIKHLRVRARAKDEVRSSGQKSCVGFYEIDWDGDVVEEEPVENLGDWHPGSYVSAGSYEQNNEYQPAWNATDDDINTLWHTDWSGCSPEDRYYEVWLERVIATSGLRYYSRPGTKNGDNNGRVGKYQVYIGDYDGNYRLVAEGEWEDTEGWKEVTWEPTRGNFVKLVGVTTYGSTPNKWMSASEIRIRAIY